MTKANPVIALEARLKGCKNVITLGVRTNFSDYSRKEADLIRKADKIYYPTTFYADLFDAMGKETFPSYHTYKCVQDKIKQTALFDLMKISHPRTKVFYGNRKKKTITDSFGFPFIAKVPRGSAMGRGVYLIKDPDDLRSYCSEKAPAYIQEYLPIDRDIRVVVIGKKIIHAYWRIAPKDDFRSNVAVGGTICLDPVPQEALDLALVTAHSCQWDDVGIDICRYDGGYYVLEANMKYGKEGFRKAGIDYKKLMENLIEKGEI
ncbi:MAG: ATP-grasp domain-containing protein [Deltaproteobacteria bacterium]|jgi:ribosomal protein S6--L-glutamate ligase|nr:ATP-grasp domain-containing protein [Deltaproteobacteria bacterium]MBW2192828.1 ATP-grasp domain-containing protein [Deltaproteobacteria bacterium]